MFHGLKFILVFALGFLAAWAGISYVIRFYNPHVLSASTGTGGNILSEFLYDQVIPQIAKSPALAPLFETKKSVEGTVEAVSSLPDAQKEAVCKELCGPVFYGKPSGR